MAFTDNIKEITPAISQLKNNTPVLIVDGKVLVGGIGGNYIPAGQGSGGGGSMGFYKCSAVDTANSTWSGYRAILNQQGYYQFQSESTEGLTYNINKIIPVAGKIYSANALCLASLWEGMPVDGLTLYVPLRDAAIAAQTGQTLTTTGTVAYTTENGIPCAYFSDDDWIAISGQIQIGTGDFAISMWEKVYDWNSHRLIWSSYGSGTRIAVLMSGEIETTTTGNSAGRMTYSADKTAWHHILFQRVSGTDYLYVDGIQVASTGDSTSLNFSQMYIGRWQSFNCMNGYMAAVRIYNRSLNQNQITLLANQFTPTSN